MLQEDNSETIKSVFQTQKHQSRKANYTVRALTMITRLERFQSQQTNLFKRNKKLAAFFSVVHPMHAVKS